MAVMAQVDSTPPPAPESGDVDRQEPSAVARKPQAGLDLQSPINPDPFRHQVERVLGGPGDVASTTRHANDTHPFLREDLEMALLHNRARGLGVPVHFVEQQLPAGATPRDYVMLLAQMVDLILYHAKAESGVCPIGLAKSGMNRHAQEAARIFLKKNTFFVQLCELAIHLRNLIHGTDE